jgi:hypothetical protein
MIEQLRFLWQSIFAPRAAVDFARQYEDPSVLGLLYAAAAGLAGFALAFVVPMFIEPLHPASTDAVMGFLDQPLVEGTMNLVFAMMFYFGFSSYWKSVLVDDAPNSAIDAGVAATFASTLVLLLPQYVIYGLYKNSEIATLLVATLVTLTIPHVLGTVYFSHAASISLTKSFFLSPFVFVNGVCVLALIAIYVFPAYFG